MSSAGRQMPARILSVLLFSDSLTTAAPRPLRELHRGDHVRDRGQRRQYHHAHDALADSRRPASTTTEFTAATLEATTSAIASQQARSCAKHAGWFRACGRRGAHGRWRRESACLRWVARAGRFVADACVSTKCGSSTTTASSTRLVCTEIHCSTRAVTTALHDQARAPEPESLPAYLTRPDPVRHQAFRQTQSNAL